MEMTRDAILRLLQELDQWMELEDCPPVDWVVCGGAALGLQELQDRPTRDVDVLAQWDRGFVGCHPRGGVGIESRHVPACFFAVDSYTGASIE